MRITDHTALLASSIAKLWEEQRFRTKLLHHGFLWLTVGCLVNVSSAQDQENLLESVQHDPEDKHKLIVLPDADEVSDSLYEAEGFEITTELKDRTVKYIARENGQTTEAIVHWEAVSEVPAHLVFDTKLKQFRRLTNKVRVILEDDTDLETIVDQTDAKSGRVYPKLGYAIVELPTEVHPAEFVKTVEGRADVRSAFVTIERPPEVPH